MTLAAPLGHTTTQESQPIQDAASPETYALLISLLKLRISAGHPSAQASQPVQRSSSILTINIATSPAFARLALGLLAFGSPTLARLAFARLASGFPAFGLLAFGLLAFISALCRIHDFGYIFVQLGTQNHSFCTKRPFFASFCTQNLHFCTRSETY